jgi:poly-D-alanine transfer protein DltD
LKNFESGNWPNEFSFEKMEKGSFKEFSEEITDDSYEALNRFYHREIKRSKAPLKKSKHAWQ